MSIDCALRSKIAFAWQLKAEESIRKGRVLTADEEVDIIIEAYEASKRVDQPAYDFSMTPGRAGPTKEAHRIRCVDTGGSEQLVDCTKAIHAMWNLKVEKPEYDDRDLAETIAEAWGLPYV